MAINLSSFVDNLVPEHVATNYPDLIEFIKVYALFLETEHRSGYYLNQLDHQRDIDLIEEHLLTELQIEIGTPIPRDFAADPRLFYKHLIEFYQSRGTPDSIKTFFRLIYDDEVEIHFPYEDMLIASDGKWYDQSADVIEAHEKFISGETATIPYAPVYTWTIGEATDYIFAKDDNGLMPQFDDGIVFVDNIIDNTVILRQNLHRYDPDDTGLIDNSDSPLHGDHYMGSMEFDRVLPAGSIVKVYRRGLYTTADGFLSDLRFIQDSHFYQRFSYVLKTGKNIEAWKSAFTRLIHPAGFIFFGEIYIFIEMLGSRIPTPPGFQWEIVHNKILSFAANIIDAPLLDRYAYEASSYYDPKRIPKYEYARGYTASNINLGIFSLEKELVKHTNINTEDNHTFTNTNLDLWDHFEGTKFSNPRPIYDYAEFTFGDVINKNIGKQFGCKITIT